MKTPIIFSFSIRTTPTFLVILTSSFGDNVFSSPTSGRAARSCPLRLDLRARLVFLGPRKFSFHPGWSSSKEPAEFLFSHFSGIPPARPPAPSQNTLVLTSAIKTRLRSFLFFFQAFLLDGAAFFPTRRAFLPLDLLLFFSPAHNFPRAFLPIPRAF